MKVLICLNSLGLGGIEVMFHQALPLLRERQIQLDFCLNERGKSLEQACIDRGARIWYLPKYANPLRTASELQAFLKEHSYDIVHSQYGYVAGGQLLGARRAGAHAIVSFHSACPTSLFSWQRWPILKQFRQLWLYWHAHLIQQNAGCVLGHSKANLDAWDPLWQQRPQHYRYIRHALSTPLEFPSRREAREALGWSSDEKMVLHVGSFREVKNHQLLLTLFSLLRQSFPRTRLVMLGEGPLRQLTEQRVKELGLEGAVEFRGEVSQPWSYYAGADLFLFPSISEGLANVLLESQAAGLPIVASDIPAHREALHPALHPFLFSLNQPEQAIEAVARQWGHRERPWLQEAQDAVVEHFSTEHFVDDLATAYSQVVEKNAQIER